MDPPFSLNLTTAEPDIQYCVDVYNVTGGGADMLESVCDITNVIYSFTPSDPSCRELYNFTVTPRSNVEGSLNGTTSNSVQGGPSLFTINPIPVIQATGVEAEFECLHPGVILAYSLIVGGSYVDSSASPLTDSPAKLTIPAISEYNNTAVECRAVVEQEGNFLSAFSCPAILIVQGSLMAVRNLGVESDQTTITISWTPPFSLNLTTAEPDIQYCVDVYNEVDALVESQYDITDTSYTFSANDPDKMFNFTVTPRSNVEGSLNGTISEQVQGFLLKDTLLPDSASPTTTGIIAGVVLIFLLILILAVVVVTLVITLRRKQGDVSMQVVSSDSRVDWSTAFPGIEQPNEAYSTVMNRNIAYEKPVRHNHPHNPPLSEGSVGEHEEIEPVHEYEEVLPQRRVNNPQYVNIDTSLEK